MLNVRRFSFAIAGAALVGLALSVLADSAEAAGTKRICVSWRHFQEERWRIDEAGVKSILDPAGYTYVSADAQSDPQKQLTDIENLLASGCDALIVLGQDPKAVVPALDRAKAAGVPTIAYDGPIDYPDALFVSFNNVAVGHLMAEAMVKARANGKWVLIEGDASHPIVQIFRAGQMEVLKPLIDKGDIKIVAQQNIPDWKPDVAQSTMEQILTQQNNKVDAVLAMNDGEAGGVAAALASQDMLGIPLSGQDGDKAAMRFYNGRSMAEMGSETGLKKNGVEKLHPMVGRGVLIDVAGYRGVDAMEVGQEITMADVRGALQRQGMADLQFSPGDVVLFRTGWPKYWIKDNAKYNSGEPGIGIEVAHWLSDVVQAGGVGSDTWATEVVPNPDPLCAFCAVHTHLLVRHGIVNHENLDLSALATDRVYRFMYVFTPAPFAGATGSPGQPIAIK